MMSPGFKEAETGRIIINDMKAEALEGILQFLYTNQIETEILQGFGQELYRAADKYNLEQLWRICEDHLLKNVTVENAVAMYGFASTSPESLLAKRSTEFISM